MNEKRIRKRDIFLTTIAVAIITVLVYLDGTDSIAVHLYYLPIIYAAFAFGDFGGVAVALIAGLLCGPWMPDRQSDGQMTAQPMWGPIVRLGMFFVMGWAAGTVARTLRRRALEAQTLYEVANSITSSLRLREVLNLIADAALKVMDARACAIRLLDQETGELRPAVMKGFSQEYLGKGKVSRDTSQMDEKVLKGEPMQLWDVRHDANFQYPEAAQAEGLTSVLSVPLRSRDEALGVLRVYSRTRRRFKPTEIELLTVFASEAAAAIEKAELYEGLRRSYYETARALTTAVEARSATTYNHSERVTQLAERLAEEMGIDVETREILRFGCILHDVGKIGVEESALEARDTGDDEQVFYRMHPLIGRSILQPVGFLQPAMPIVVHHHERWDGNGFPEGLAGEDIPLLARICAVCDAYERLRSPQEIGESGMEMEEALQEIVAGAGTRFDPEVVSALQRAKEDPDFRLEDR